MYVVIYSRGVSCSNPIKDLREAIIKAESLSGRVYHLTEIFYKATYQVVDKPVQIVNDDE